MPNSSAYFSSQNTPPTKNGVSASKVYLPKLDQMPASVFAYLCDKFAHISVDAWRQRFADGEVLSAAGEAVAIDAPYRYGETVYYYRKLEREVVVPFEYQIVYENEAILVVDKPHFLTITPTGQYVQQTLLTRLKNDTGIDTLAPAHRLDRETAGLVLFTKSPEHRSSYQQLFATQRIHKVYHAIAPLISLPLPLDVHLQLVRGEPFYTMKVGSGEPNSHTHIALLECFHHPRGSFGKYQLTPTTGKLHQLRVHLAHLGAPIVNDSFYPIVAHKNADDFSQPLQLLAKHLSFIDPLTNEPLSFVSPQALQFGVLDTLG